MIAATSALKRTIAASEQERPDGKSARQEWLHCARFAGREDEQRGLQYDQIFSSSAYDRSACERRRGAWQDRTPFEDSFTVK